MLREFLSKNRTAIIERTRAKIGARRAPRATEEELETGIPIFLDQLIDILRASGGPSEAMGESASRHGRELLEEGFTVAQVVHDYGGVCSAIAELASESGAQITSDEFRTLNGCVDDAIAHAVTEHTRQREQSIAAEGQERLGALAHELRNALSGATITFEMLRRGSVGFGGSTAAVLDRSLRRIGTLVDSSLADVRLAAGIRAPERVSVREFVEEVEVGAVLEANARDFTFSVATVEPGVDVEADRQFLAAAVANLLHNAFKFSRRRGHVVLQTSATPSRVLIEVADECGGLPAGQADVMFRPFQQAGSNKTGAGLGLSIARKSVAIDGGDLRVRDVPGHGCVFTIDLPRLAPGP